MRFRPLVVVSLVGSMLVGSLLGAGVSPARALVPGPCPPGAPPNSSLCNSEAFVLLDEAADLGLGSVAAGEIDQGVGGIAIRNGVGDALRWLAVASSGLSDQTLEVSGNPDGLLLPAPQRGWVGGRNYVEYSSSRATSWTVGADPATPVAGETIPVTVRLDTCPSGSGTAYLGVHLRYFDGDSGFVTGEQVSYGTYSCGAPIKVTVDVPAMMSGKPLNRVEAFDQGVAGCGYGDIYECLTWYPRWSPDRPVAPSAFGTMTRNVVCTDGAGTTTRLSSSWHGDIFVPGSYLLPDVKCPPGTVVESISMDWAPDGGSGTQTVVPPTQTPAWVASMLKQYPQCFVSGADCRMELWDVSGASARSCGILAVDCLFWYVSTTRATDYECRWGPYQIDLSYCSALRDPGRLLPNAHLDALGQLVFDLFPPLELDSGVVAALANLLTSRYPKGDDACNVLGESVRALRGAPALIVPDVVWDCTTYGIADALQFVTDTGGSLGQKIAVAALTLGVFGGTPTTYPDCDKVSAGICLDPQRNVSVDGWTWATGPRYWTSPSPQQVTNALNTCVGLVQRGFPSLSAEQARSKCQTQPVFVPGGKKRWGKEAAAHDLDVITGHPNLVQLQYVSGTNKKTYIAHNWYGSGDSYLAPCSGKAGMKAGLGMECDEYPFYTSVEGGRIAYNTYGPEVLAPVDRTDNRREGNALNAMYRDKRCNMTSATVNSAGAAVSPGSSYLVVPLPDVDVPSFYLCAGQPALLPSSTTLAQDTFDRTITGGWGSADQGGNWAVTGGASKFSVAGGRGLVQAAAGMTYGSTLDMVPSELVDVTLTTSADKVPGGGGSYQTVQTRRISADEYYGARVKVLADGQVELHLIRSGTVLTGGAVAGMMFGAGDQLQVRAQTFGIFPTTVRAKVWKVGTAEPEAWAWSAADAENGLQAAGTVGLSTYLSASAANGPVTFSYGDLTVEPVRGYVPAQPGVLAIDTFDRTVTGGWGTADRGGDWTLTGGASKFGVADGRGLVQVAAGTTYTSALGSVPSQAADVMITMSADKVPDGGGSYQTIQSRRVSADQYYGARVKILANGQVELHLMRSGTILTGGVIAGLTFEADDRLQVRVQTSGSSPTTLQAKVWKVGTPEPAGWAWSATDFELGLQQPGTIGLTTYLSASATNPVTFTYTDLAAVDPTAHG